MSYLLLIVVSSLAFFSCSDDPTSNGLGIIPGEDRFDTYTASSDTFAQSSSFRKGADINIGGTSVILLGNYENTKSSALIQFYLGTMADSLKNDIDEGNINVIKAWISADPVYYIGNKNAAFNYTVHNVRSDWGINKFNKDSLAALQYDAQDIATNKFEDSFFIDNSTVLNWLKSEADTSLTDYYGILLQPSGSQKIVGYYSGTSTTKYKPFVLNVIIQKPGVYQDTIPFITLNNTFTSVIEYTVPNPQTGYMFVQGAIPVHSEWNVDVSGIPEKSVINSAVLDIYFDSTKSHFGVPASDSLIVRFDSAATSYDSVQIAILVRNGNKFTGDITYFIQQFVNKVDNKGLLLSLHPYKDELTSVDLLALYSTEAADVQKRPKLNIRYSVIKDR